MRIVGLSFGEPFTGICVLDSGGQMIEMGMARSTEAAFRQRFAGLPRCVIAAAYDRRSAPLLHLLSELGHTVLIGGRAAERLRPVLAPLAARAPLSPASKRSTAVARLNPPQGGAELMFVLHLRPAAAGVEVDDAWYFTGPVHGADALDRAPARQAPAVPADEQAAWLWELLSAVDVAEIVHGGRSGSAAA